jgi:hypothetical protein
MEKLIISSKSKTLLKVIKHVNNRKKVLQEKINKIENQTEKETIKTSLNSNTDEIFEKLKRHLAVKKFIDYIGTDLLSFFINDCKDEEPKNKTK